ncbi:MAG: hypothetical protein ACE10O_07090, partial [Candidatus Acidiferrales bacterium]
MKTPPTSESAEKQCFGHERAYYVQDDRATVHDQLVGPAEARAYVKRRFGVSRRVYYATFYKHLSFCSMGPAGPHRRICISTLILTCDTLVQVHQGRRERAGHTA